MAVQRADGDAGVAGDPFQGGIHATGGELALRRGDEPVVTLLGVAASGRPQLLDVAEAHVANVSREPE